MLEKLVSMVPTGRYRRRQTKKKMCSLQEIRSGASSGAQQVGLHLPRNHIAGLDEHLLNWRHLARQSRQQQSHAASELRPS